MILLKVALKHKKSNQTNLEFFFILTQNKFFHNWVTNKIIQVSIILFSNALHCTPCVPSFPFFFYFRDFDSQFTCTNSCHLSVCYICLINQIIVIIVYKFIIWLFCSQECHWLTNIAFVCMSANFIFCLKVNIIKQK